MVYLDYVVYVLIVGSRCQPTQYNNDKYVSFCGNTYVIAGKNSIQFTKVRTNYFLVQLSSFFCIACVCMRMYRQIDEVCCGIIAGGAGGFNVVIPSR